MQMSRNKTGRSLKAESGRKHERTLLNLLRSPYGINMKMSLMFTFLPEIDVDIATSHGI